MFLYWIKRKCHTNIYSEGYVGISQDPIKRFKEHKLYKKKHKLTSALKKYDDIEMKVLFENNEYVCRFLEHCYRPIDEIGWNVTAGGGMPPKLFGNKHRVGKTLTYEHKNAISKGIKGLTRSTETRAKISLAMTGKKKNVTKKRKSHTSETKLKISSSKKGVLLTEEHKRKISEGVKFRKRQCQKNLNIIRKRNLRPITTGSKDQSDMKKLKFKMLIMW